MAEVSVYPVGLWRDLKRGRLYLGMRYLRIQVARRDWRAVRNYFSGYLAEPREMPPGCWRCGTGWTRGRALRDWQRHARRNATGGDGDGHG